MANLSKLKRPNSLGAPPPHEEASGNLKASEIAPGNAALPSDAPVRPPRTSEPASHPFEIASVQQSRLDGRSLRKSGRLIPFATRVTPEFDDRIRKIAQRDGVLLVEVLEQGLDAYEASRR